ncbi:hypothetical protein R1sor_004003 [Riccia sorocarpa]|uniref:Endonuclease/exonuclease/phosphatase domain-containing protein n=1 Tax=Riccia sorocarpa TaxID=122646 RepID=A0ABD3H5F7_9MARC
MDSPEFVSPIRPTWIELVNLPSFISQSQLNQLIANVGAVVRIPYISQKLALASVRALILWDFPQPLVEELNYTVDNFPFRLKLRYLGLGEACSICGFSHVQGCKCNKASPSATDPIPPCPPGPTDIAIQEFQQLNKGPMAIPDTPASTETAWKEDTALHPVSFVQLLNQQSLGAYEANQRMGIQPMEEDMHSSPVSDQDFTFGITSVYSPNFSSQRLQIWKSLRMQLPYRPWILCGDMNMVETPEDASGESPLLKGSERVEFHSYFKVDPTILTHPKLMEQITQLWEQFERQPTFQYDHYMSY